MDDRYASTGIDYPNVYWAARGAFDTHLTVARTNQTSRLGIDQLAMSVTESSGPWRMRITNPGVRRGKLAVRHVVTAGHVVRLGQKGVINSGSAIVTPEFLNNVLRGDDMQRGGHRRRRCKFTAERGS